MGGNTAPPAMAMIMSDDPSLVRWPKSLTPRANTVGHMMDMNRVVNHKAHIADQPDAVMAMLSNPMLITA